VAAVINENNVGEVKKILGIVENQLEFDFPVQYDL
jgi:hypothetical protein